MKEAIKPISRLWRILRLYRKDISQIYLYAVLNGLVNLSLPLGIQAIINFIQSGEISSSWVVLVGFVLAGIAVTGILQVLQLRIVENIQQNIFARSSFEFAARLPKIKLSELNDIHAPELVNRFFDTLTIQKGLPKILIDFSLASFQVVFGLLLLAFYSPYFIILGLLLCFILWLIFRITGPLGLQTSLKESKYKYQMAHWLEEVARTNKSFKLSANSTLHLHRTDDIAANYLGAREKHFRVLLTQFKYFIGFKILIAAGLLVLGSILVFQQQMNIGQFVASEIIIILIINSVEKIIGIFDTIYDVLTALEKIGYVTDLDLDERQEAGFSSGEQGIAVEALNLGYSYPDAKKKLLKNLSFQIPAGAKVTVAGESGSGKSTLLHLIAGLYDLDDGEILLNDRPVHHSDKEKLYAEIGFFFPSNQLFEGTISENIRLGRDIPDEDVLDAIKLLGLKEYVALKPKGVHSFIDPEGKRLPRSIVQRLLIARAIVHQPRLLIMEDPFQYMSDEHKKAIVDYIVQPDRKWTVIITTEYAYWTKKSTQTITLNGHA